MAGSKKENHEVNEPTDIELMVIQIKGATAKYSTSYQRPDY